MIVNRRDERYDGAMKRGGSKEYAGTAGLIFGLLFFPFLQLASLFFLQEGIVTFWIAQSLGLARDATVAATSTDVIAPPKEIDRARPLAIMIDNHPDARPQSGVSKADVVWEVPVEGGLTRNMLIFRSTVADEIGPVRSARPYFLDWASEFDAVYTHVGGSDEALADLASKTSELDNVDEFKFGTTFWRDSRRSAPHNAYTSTEKLWALIDKNGWASTTQAVDPTLRADLSATGVPATKAVVTYVQNGETAEFRWDAAQKGYALWRGGRVARDRDGTPIMPKTVVVLEAKIIPINDPQGKGLIGIKTFDTGSATVLRDGVAVHGSWKKTSAASPTVVTDADGKQIPFADGQIWYAVVGANRGGGVEIGP